MFVRCIREKQRQKKAPAEPLFPNPRKQHACFFVFKRESGTCTITQSSTSQRERENEGDVLANPQTTENDRGRAKSQLGTMVEALPDRPAREGEDRKSGGYYSDNLQPYRPSCRVGRHLLLADSTDLSLVSLHRLCSFSRSCPPFVPPENETSLCRACVGDFERDDHLVNVCVCGSFWSTCCPICKRSCVDRAEVA